MFQEDEFVTFEDGFVYYWPSCEGGYTAHHLREIADELDRRNERMLESFVKQQYQQYLGDSDEAHVSM